MKSTSTSESFTTIPVRATMPIQLKKCERVPGQPVTDDGPFQSKRDGRHHDNRLDIRAEQPGQHHVDQHQCHWGRKFERAETLGLFLLGPEELDLHVRMCCLEFWDVVLPDLIQHIRLVGDFAIDVAERRSTPGAVERGEWWCIPRVSLISAISDIGTQPRSAATEVNAVGTHIDSR